MIRQALGHEPADLVLKGCRIVNVFTRELQEGDIAICRDRIAGIGQYNGIEEIDCSRYIACPGFIEGHIHIESSLLSPQEFAFTILASGTTTVVCDPHEIANVCGVDGIKYMLESTSNLPVSIFVMTPSCVPATHMETSGASLDQTAVTRLYRHPRVIGLAEMMNYPGLLAGDPKVIDKILYARNHGRPVDGHAPGVSGNALQAYISTGIGSDHECTGFQEAVEKIRAGLRVFIREGGAAQNLEALLPAVTDKNLHRFLLVTDDCHPHDLLEGHLDRVLRKAVRLGLDPIAGISMVTINAAEHFSFADRGAIAPGYRADIVMLDGLHTLNPHYVFSAGRLVACDRKIITTGRQKKNEEIVKKYPRIFSSVRIPLSNLDFAIPAKAGKMRVIGIVKNQILTQALEITARIENSLAVADPVRDLAKIAVIERHRGTGGMGMGFVVGIGLRHGALACSIAHDSHNIIVVGMSDQDMRVAVECLAGMGGGLVVASDNRVLSRLELGIAGLMSVDSIEKVVASLNHIMQQAQSLGVYDKNPFLAMSFLALPVIPHLKLTDRGLVDVDAFKLTGLWV